MGKEIKQRRDQKKKPLMSLKEKRAKKHEKKLHQGDHERIEYTEIL